MASVTSIPRIWLQRGRAPKSAECDAFWKQRPISGSFNGAALRRARSVCHRDLAVSLPEAASTGPRSEERGVGVADGSGTFAGVLLQRGRAPKSAECAMVSTSRVFASSFNGAALRRARSEERRIPHARSVDGFNGAALRRARSAKATSPLVPPPPSFNGAALRRARSGRKRAPRAHRGIWLQRGRAPKSAEWPLL